MNASALPSSLGKYWIQGLLGEGAMGVVYRGYDPELDRQVAVKTMKKSLLAGPTGAEMLERFKREAAAGMRLSHKHVVTVYEYGEDAEQVFMAMEFINGKSLRELNAVRAPWPLLEALELAYQLLEALDFFHERGVVHRDIKPANIMVDAAGILTVTDFGIARVDASELTQVGTILGTPSYMSPEQITGMPIDGRSDLFAVGVILYEMLTAEKPFRGEVITMAHNIVSTPHPDPSTRNATLPPAVDRMFRRALAKKPDDRFRNGAEFRAALREMLDTILPRGDGADGDLTLRVTPAAVHAEPAKPVVYAEPTKPARAPEVGSSPLPPSRPTATSAAATAAPLPADEPSTPSRRLYSRCPSCGTRFDSPRPWNAVCSGCGAALFEAEKNKGRGSRTGSPLWLILVAVVFVVGLLLFLRR